MTSWEVLVWDDCCWTVIASYGTKSEAEEAANRIRMNTAKPAMVCERQ